jgi:hypothetical protein
MIDARLITTAFLSASAWLAAGCAGAPAGSTTVPAASRQMVVVPYEEARFVPSDPARRDGPEHAVLWGDPSSGPSAMLLRMKAGPGRLHRHTADYHLVLLEGAMKHVAKGTPEAEARRLGPGSYWFQPGGKPHADSCLSDHCLMFITWAGKRDGVLDK